MALITRVWGRYDWPAGSGNVVCVYSLVYNDQTNDVQTVTVRNEHATLWAWGQLTVEAGDRNYAYGFAPRTETVIPVPQSVGARLRFFVNPGNSKLDGVLMSSTFPADPPAVQPVVYPPGTVVTPL